MEKIKNILSGHKDEATTHESGTHTTGTSGHTAGLAGEGSHLSKETPKAGDLSGQHGVENAGNTGLMGRNTADDGLSRGSGRGVLNTGNNSGLTGQEDDGIPRGSGGGILNSSGNHSNLTGQGSHLGSARDTTNTGNVTGTGLGHTQHSGIGHDGTSTNPSGLTSFHTGQTGHSGPHQTEAANRLDPSVNTSSGSTEDAHHHSHKHGGGAEEADQHHLGGKSASAGLGSGVAEHEHNKHQGAGSTGIGSSTGQRDTTNSGNHLGRDVAVGAGGVGLAQHEHNKHQTPGNTVIGSTGIHSEHQPGATAGLDGPAPNTAGPHKQDWLNKLDPRVNANPETASTGTGPFKVSAADYPPGTSKPYDPTTGHIANPAHHGIKSVNPDGSTTKTANPAHHGGSTADTLPGRSAATVGVDGVGAGAGALGHEAGHHRRDDSGVAGISSGNTTTGPHSSKLANQADPSVDSDRSKDHHLGRDAAVAGGVGGAAYEAEKHHNKHDTTATEKHHNKHDTTTTNKHDTHNKDTKGGLLSFLHRDKNKKYTKDEEDEFDRQEREHNSSHKGAAALGGATTGGAAHSQYKSDQYQHASGYDNNKSLPNAPGNHGIGTGAGTGNALAGDGGNLHSTGDNRQQHAAPLAETPVGQDLGDKLHGVERNRGVTGASGFPGTEGFGSSTAGAHSGAGYTGHTGEQSHLGRDAALGAGGVGAAQHEHHKHESLTGTQSHGLTGSGNQHDTQSSGLAGQHSTGLGSSALGGENEYRKTDTTSGLTPHPGQESGITGNQSSGITGSHGLTGHSGQDSGITGDRNRLHKDAPAGHVPASGSERERLVGEGERTIDGNTGVAGSHSNAPHTGTNY